MATPSWQVTGQYYETCSCDFACSCVVGGLAVRPTKGWCTVAMSFQIERGSYGTVTLDGLGFIVLLWTPEEMGKGNWSVGVIADARANAEQHAAISAIASGSAGGPMAALAGLVGKFLGVESAPIRFERDGAKWSVTASAFVSMSAAPAMGIDPTAQAPLELANTGHPANSRVSLAHALHSKVNVLGLAWNDESGRNSRQYARFTWANA